MLSRLPSIAIIVATWNAAAGLRRTLQSIAKQDYPMLEVIVVDGGSSDDTPQVMIEWQQTITRSVSERDRGIADAYNKGTALVAADWVFFLNADDVFRDVGVLREVMTAGDLADRFDLIIGKVEADNGRVFDGRLGWKLCIRNTVHHQGMFYRRSFLEQRPFNIAYRRYGHDHEHNLKLWLEKARVVYVDVVVALWATGGASDSAAWRDYREEFAVRRNTIGVWSIAFDVFTPVRFVAKRLKKVVARHQSLRLAKQAS